MSSSSGGSGNNVSSESAGRGGSPRLLFSLLALAGVAACFVFGEWQILSPFSRFLSTSMDKAFLEIMPSTLIERSTTAGGNAFPTKPRIKRIVLLGERHSGTSYTTRKLAECFPDLEVTDLLVRFKHWFQPPPEYVVNVTKTLFRKDSYSDAKSDLPEHWPTLASLKEPENAFDDTLLILMFRNAYDWLDAMREGPHHWPNHFELFKFPNGPHADVHGNGQLHEYGVRPYEWTEFVKANMTLSRDMGNASHICQNAYLYGQVSPCLRSKELYPDVVRKDYFGANLTNAPDLLNFNADRPIYEMQPGTNLPFENPLDFRTAKIQNFLDIPNHWKLGGIMTLQHEQVNEMGSSFVLDRVSDLVGKNAICAVDPPKQQKHKEMDASWQEWITKHADWQVEAKIGYKPRPPPQTIVKETKVDVPQVQKSSISDTKIVEEASAFDRIVLLGERHSGTTYTTKMLERCFPDVEVSDFLVRFKHWFQPTPDYVATTTKEYLKNDIGEEEGEDMYEIHNQWPNIAAMDEPKNAFKRTLLIVMFRNPYDWMEAMRAGPHHWTNHFSMYRFPRAPVPDTTGNPWYGSNFTTWNDFVQANMTLAVDDGSEGTQLCQNGFMKGSVTPCLKSKSIYPKEVQKDYPDDISQAPDVLPFNAHHPIYELDPTNGKPYADPLAFRTAKIQNFLDIPNHWDLGSFMTLTHEQVNAEGSGFLLEKVSKILGQDPVCDADPPKNQPARVINPNFLEWITENADWETEGKVGYEPRPSKKVEEAPKIERIVLLGERHSGTSYTTAMLQKCFPTLDVDDFLGRYKHWFQPTPEYMVNVTKTFLDKPKEHEEVNDLLKISHQWPKLVAQSNPKENAFKDTLLIVMFRNAYDWLEAMREGPHHWPNHFDILRIDKGDYGIELYDWNKFVAANMTFIWDDKANSSNLCQNGYPFGSVTPCLKSKELYPDIVKKDYTSDLSAAPDVLVYNAHNPIYEMDENGKPFAHPLALRAAKIKNFLDIPNQWDLGGFIKLQHEQVNMQGSAFLLDQVSKIVGLKPECTPDPPKKQSSKELESDWSDWITKNADWETEKQVGYEPRVSTSSRSKSV